MRKSMLEAGYSEAMAKNPQKLTRSKGWTELINQYLPEKLLLQRLKQLLNKRITYWVGEGENRRLIRTKEIDPASVAKALDMAYKIRGKYQVETNDRELERQASMDEIIERASRLLPDAVL